MVKLPCFANEWKLREAQRDHVTPKLSFQRPLIFFHYTAQNKTKGKNLYHLDKNLFPFLLKKFLYQYIFKRISSKKAIKITV